MPSTPCRVIITPDVDVDVTIYTAGGNEAPAFTTENGSSQHSFPVTVTAGTSTTFWLTTTGTFSISALSNSVEIAGDNGDRLSVGLDPGGSASIGVRADLPSEIAAVSTGTGASGHLQSVDVLFTEEATAGAAGLAITAVVASPGVTHAITAVDQAAKQFTIAGDHYAEYNLNRLGFGATVAVAGSTGNDGAFTPTAASFDGANTIITVAEAITSAVADGTIVSPVASFTVAGDHSSAFLVNDLCAIEGSTLNDGFYNVARVSVAGGNTTVLLGGNQLATDATVDGSIRVSSYRATVALPAGSIVDSVRWFPLEAPWAADSVFSTVFDTRNPYTLSGVDLQAASNVFERYDATAIAPNVNELTLVAADTYAANAYNAAGAEFHKGANLAGSWAGPGIYYREADTLSVTALVQITAPPVTPSGVTLIKVLYWSSNVVDAVFA